MSEIFFGIPSYGRPDAQPTLDMLLRFGVKPGNIIISVQTQKDKEAYRRYEKSARIIYRDGKNKSANANNILDLLTNGSKLVLLDDDIKAISCLTADRRLRDIDTVEQFVSMLKVGFAVARKHRAPGFGLYPVHNAFFMGHSYSPRNICIGTVLGLVVTKQRFDTRFDVKEDYEYTASAIKRYGSFIRLNNFSPDAAHYTKGGCEASWKDGYTNGYCAGMLCRRYPTIVKANKSRMGEVKMAHPAKAIPYRWKYEGEARE